MNSISAATESQTGNISIKSALTVDNTAPNVTAVDPANKTTNVPSNKVIKVTFSEAVKSGNNWIELKTSNGTLVPVNKSISGSVLTITPTTSLTENKYNLILHTGSITDLNGNHISLWTSSFSVGTSPTVIAVDPANKTVNVPINKIIKVTFNENVKLGTGWIELKSSNGTLASIIKSISGKILTITPTNLAEDTKYYLSLHTGSITDLSGNKISLWTSSFSVDSPGYTMTEIEYATGQVKTFIENTHTLPQNITLSTTKPMVPVHEFLQMLLTSVLQLHNGVNTSISAENISAPTSSTGSYIYGNINETEYLNIAQAIQTYIDTNNKVPGNASSSLGTIRYETLVYLYSKIINYYGTNGQLPSYVSVDSSIANPESSNVPSSLQQYLQATTNCQVNDPSIQAKAKSIISGQTTVYGKAVAIYNWIRDNLGYSFYYNTKYGAVGTLNAMTGNCVDTAHLLIALERAVGIPARYEHVYAQFSSGTWYGHVIAQVWVNGVWYDADGTSTRNSFGVINNWNTTTATYYGTYATLPF